MGNRFAEQKFSFDIGFEELKHWDETANAWRMPAGDVAFMAG